MAFPNVSRFRDVLPRPVVVAEHSATNVRERRMRVARLAICGDIRLPNVTVLRLRLFVLTLRRFDDFRRNFRFFGRRLRLLSGHLVMVGRDAI